MTKRQTKELLLQKGAEIMHRKGFSESGIQEVLESTGVPKGSFYYYFKSKEDFGLQVLDLYSAVMLQTLQTRMALTDILIIDRIRGFFRDMTNRAVENEFTGCPIGNLSQEMGSINSSFSRKLNDIFSKLESDLARCIGEAQLAGEISKGLDPGRAAIFLVSSWEGALLRMKLTKNTIPYDVFEQTAFGNILAGALRT